MEKEKQKKKSQARKLHTNWNTTNHGLTFRNTIGTMCRKADEDVRHKDIQRNYAMLLRTGPGTDTCSTWCWLRMEWKQTQSLISTSTMTVLADAEILSGDKLKSDATCGHLLHTACNWGWNLPPPPPPAKAGERGCLINAKLLDDLHHKHYSKSTRVPQIWILKALSKGRRHNQNHIKSITFS